MGLTIVDTTTPGPMDFSVCVLWDRIDAEILAAANASGASGPGSNSNIGAADGGSGSNGAIVALGTTALVVALVTLELPH